MEKKFEEIIDEIRDELKTRGKYGSSSNMLVNAKHRIGVIGIRTYEDKNAQDTIHVFREDSGLKKVLNLEYNPRKMSTRMFMNPTEILEDGTGFKYDVIDSSRKRHKKIYRF